MEKKQIKMSLGTFIAIMVAVILVVVVVFMGIHIANQNKQIEESKITVASNEKEETTKNIETTTNTANTNNVVAKELDINSDLVQKLHGYITDNDRIRFEPNTYLSFYRSEKMTNTTLEDDIKLLTVLMSLLDDKKYSIIKNEELKTENVEGIGLCKCIELNGGYYYDYMEAQGKWNKIDSYKRDVVSNVYVFNMDSIQERAKEIFNTTINIKKHSFEYVGEGFFYDNNTYKYFSFDGGGDFDNWENSKISKVEQKGDEIYIYDNYIMIEDPHSIEGISVYATSELKNLIYKAQDIDYDDPIQQLKQLKITLPLYKHTFKKSNTGTYYWVSSELINKNELKTVN